MMMAMKLLATLVLFISIGSIHSKTLLEKIQDDSDLSQVSRLVTRCFMASIAFALLLKARNRKRKRQGVGTFWKKL